jgi:hypothetical protein
VTNFEMPSGRTRRLASAAGLLAVMSLLAAACGGGGSSAAKAPATTTAPVTTTTTPAAATNAGGAGSPGGASAFGPAATGKIASITGNTLEVQNTETGQTTVDLTASTTITASLKASLSDVTVGECVTATGSKGLAGAVKATSVTIFSSTSGTCNRGFGGGGGAFGGGGFGGRTGGTFPGAGSRPRTTVTRPTGTVAFASGKVTAVSGSTITVQGTRFAFAGGRTSTTNGALGTTTTVSPGPEIVTVSSATKYLKSGKATASQLTVGECATAIGSTNSIGVVTARALTITQPTSTGCTASFGGFGGGFGRGGGGGGGAGGAGGGAA